MDAMGDREGPRLVSSTALWRGDRRPAQVVQASQLEQDFQRAPQQGESGSLPFDTEYSRWLEEHTKHINELRTAVNSHASDPELRSIVDNVIAHYDEVYKMKANAAKGNIEHLLSGMWKTPAERCFMWIGDFRPSLLLKLLGNQLEPLSEQQLLAIKNLQLSSHNSEDALSQGMQALEQSLGETLAIGSPFTEGSSGNVATKYMGQMEMAMGKLVTLEAFLCQTTCHVHSPHPASTSIASNASRIDNQTICPCSSCNKWILLASSSSQLSLACQTTRAISTTCIAVFC